MPTRKTVTRTGSDPATGTGGPRQAGLARLFTGHTRSEDELGVMSRRVLRCALVVTVVAGALALVWSLSAALTLTAAGLVSSFSFRGLEMQVRALEPRADGRLGAKNILFIVLRYSLLSAFIVAALLVGSREFIALILGFSVVPLALLISELAARFAPVR
jgi:hypothetical protein